jgi:RNA polymerase sigma-70 factor, ECF subfamily
MDRQLVVQAQEGDLAAFGSLVDAIGDRFLAVAQGILRERSLAEDAVQQALVSIWRDLPALREPDRFNAWSHRLLVRACYAEARRSRGWITGIVAGDALEPSTADASAGVADRDQLERGFRRLSIDHRTVVVLHHLLDLPLEEVAVIVGAPRHTVRSRLYHAMRQLRAALVADDRPGTSREGMEVVR